jgi:glutamate dehydrogenase/leucine dehydrogenase
MNEVLSLRTMEVKFSVSGPAIGGAKSGINFDPNDPRKRRFATLVQSRFSIIKVIMELVI